MVLNKQRLTKVKAMFTKKQLSGLLRDLWSDNGVILEDGLDLGPDISKMTKHFAEQNNDRDLPYLELWITIFDELNKWLVSLLWVLTDGHPSMGKSSKGKSTNFDTSVFVLLSKIIGDTNSIRHLILLGFDNSARTILRSTAEYMEVLVAVMHDPKFSNEFVKSNTPETAKYFWENYLRSGKIRKRIRSAWYEYYNARGDQEITEIADRGHKSMSLLSSMAHPSYSGGVFTTIPPRSHYENDEWRGFWGTKTDLSVFTIYIYAAFVYPIMLLSKEYPFDGYEKYMGEVVPYDDDHYIHVHVKYGRHVLTELLDIVCGDMGDNEIFPEFDYSIYPEDDEI